MSQPIDVCFPAQRKRGRLRQACNSCSRIKKKCDGSRPCTLCVKNKLECVYEERVRPGPPVKQNSSNSSSSGNNNRDVVLNSSSSDSTTSDHISMIKSNQRINKSNKDDKILKLTNQSLISINELNLLSLYVDNINNFIPILSKHILSDSLKILGNETNALTNSFDIISKICLAWCSCTIISYLRNDPSFSLYLSYTFSYIRRLLDGTSIYVSKALIAYEILLSICTNQSNIDICKGSYYKLGENIYKLNNDHDNSSELLYSYYYFTLIKFPTNRLLSLVDIWQIAFNNLPIAFNKCPIRYSYAICFYWFHFITYIDLADVINKIDVNEIVQSYKLDIHYIKEIEGYLLPSEKNNVSLLIYHISLCMNRIIFNQFDRVYESCISIAKFIINNPLLIINKQLYTLSVTVFNLLLLLPNFIDVSNYPNISTLLDEYKMMLNHQSILFYYDNSLYIEQLYHNVNKLLVVVSNSTTINPTNHNNYSINNTSNSITTNAYNHNYLNDFELNLVSIFTKDKQFLQLFTTEHINRIPTLSELALNGNYLDKLICYNEFDQPLLNSFDNIEKINNSINIIDTNTTPFLRSNKSSLSNIYENNKSIAYTDSNASTDNNITSATEQKSKKSKINLNKVLFQSAYDNVSSNNIGNSSISNDIDYILDQIISMDTVVELEQNYSYYSSANVSNNCSTNNSSLMNSANNSDINLSRYNEPNK